MIYAAEIPSLILAGCLVGGGLIVAVGLWAIANQIVSAYRFTSQKERS